MKNATKRKGVPRKSPKTLVGGFALFVGVLFGSFGCSAGDGTAPDGAREVVVYTAHDQIFSEPILRKFEKETGIRVRAVYDAEAVKTVGLVNRLIAERARPRCDVFWNNEILRTLVLKREGLTQPYHSPSAANIPEEFKDPEGHWTGFAARARVNVYHTGHVASEEAPTRMEDLLDPRWRGRCAIAQPLFGTTATHAAALWHHWGPERTQAFFLGLIENGVLQLPGNALVRDQVALGELPWGMTDTDDLNVALIEGRPVGASFPMHEAPEGGSGGILMIPNTVFLVAGAPNPEAGRRLIDFLLSEEIEAELARGPAAQLPVRAHLDPPPGWEILRELPRWTVDWEGALDALEPSAAWLDKHYVR